MESSLVRFVALQSDDDFSSFVSSSPPARACLGRICQLSLVRFVANILWMMGKLPCKTMGVVYESWWEASWRYVDRRQLLSLRD